MRILSVLLILALAPLAHAENPYTDLSAPELRTRLAKVPAVEQESWYQVEVMVFARTGPTTQEYWRLDQRPHLAPENAIHLDGVSPLLPEGADTLDSSAARLGAWRLLERDRMILTDMLSRMEKAGDFRTLYHQTWIQPIRERARAFPIYIEGGNQVSAQPSISPDAGQDYGLPPLETTTEEASDPVPPAMQSEFQGMLRLHLSRYLHVEPDLWFTRNSGEGQPYWVHINQKRRMRSEELHYLDHPLFGMLVRITPYQTETQKNVELMKEALKQK